jgi:alkylation response protein AidB-like acyl-CoA dehydrogenase
MTTLLDKKRSATSNVQSPDKATLDQVLSRIGALAPMVARLAPDIEQGRRLPAELVSALKSARIYDMLVPRRYGGLELDAPSTFRVVSALAKLDGSVGWNAMIGHLGSLMPFNCKRWSGSPRPASASPKAALNSPEAGPCTKAHHCSEGCGIFASRPNTLRPNRATT